jgi:hypothetical protein
MAAWRRFWVMMLLVALPAAAFAPTGEVLFRTRSGMYAGVAYSGERIVGPGVDLSRVPDNGGWAGTIEGAHTQLWPTRDGLSGEAVVSDLPSAKITLHISRSKDGTEVRGLFFGAMAHLEIAPKEISGRMGDCSLELTRRAPGIYEGEVGCTPRGVSFPQLSKGTLRLLGDAAHPDAPMPQLALALMAVLPR